MKIDGYKLIRNKLANLFLRIKGGASQKMQKYPNPSGNKRLHFFNRLFKREYSYTQLLAQLKMREQEIELLKPFLNHMQELIRQFDLSTKINSESIANFQKENHLLQSQLNQMNQNIQQLTSRTENIVTENLKHTALFQGIDQRIGQLRSIQLLTEAASRASHEALWAEIYNNTVSIENNWLKDKAFSPGRMAVGYPFLYLLFRVLNEFGPRNILELGLGQSTRMISQYVAAHDNTIHYVVEDNQEWIDFFSRGYSLSERTKLMHFELEMRSYKQVERIRTYSGFERAFQGQHFHLIVIDAPFGGDMKELSRIDILSLLPDCLEESFVIMFDDCERSGEKATAFEIDRILHERNIEYRFGKYWGKKDMLIWCSPDIGFFCTL